MDGKPAADERTYRAAGRPPSPELDDWETEQRLRHIERVLDTDPAPDARAESLYRRQAARFDLPHSGPAAWHPGLKPSAQPPAAAAHTGSGMSGLGSLALLLGTTALVCGGVLMGWSLATGRQELWTIGLPVMLCGQIGLLVGLVFQLERLWRDSRRASVQLETVDRQLHDLQAAATLVGSTSQSPATAFYTHLAHGAGPELLLTDLKSQIDLLALKMSQQS